MAQKTLNFTKMVGAGNDFILIEPIKSMNYKRLAVKICCRTNGVGADGLIIVDKSRKQDYKMRIINPDGSEAEMCGNGVRCAAVYIKKYKKPKKGMFSIETLAGEILGQAGGETANVRLTNPKGYTPAIPLTINGNKIRVHFIDTGVPHTVIYVDSLSVIPIREIGNAVRFHKRFQPRGTNVNFVEQLRPGLVEVRTYERGVEDETKACGTGSVAAALVSYMQANPKISNKKKARMDVLTKSGEVLSTVFDVQGKGMTNVWLKGSAKFVASGKYYL